MNKYLLYGAGAVVIVVGCGLYLNQPIAQTLPPATLITPDEQSKVSKELLPPLSVKNEPPQPVTGSSKYGTLAAAPVGSSAVWQFAVKGNFGIQQDSYAINFGDGSTSDLTCAKTFSTEPVCLQFTPVSHTYTENGLKKASLILTTRGLGNSEVIELTNVSLNISR